MKDLKCIYWTWNFTMGHGPDGSSPIYGTDCTSRRFSSRVEETCVLFFKTRGENDILTILYHPTRDMQSWLCTVAYLAWRCKGPRCPSMMMTSAQISHNNLHLKDIQCFTAMNWTLDNTSYNFLSIQIKLCTLHEFI